MKRETNIILYSFSLTKVSARAARVATTVGPKVFRAFSAVKQYRPSANN
jgi:hypothetical protein